MSNQNNNVNNVGKAVCIDCPGEDAQKMDSYFFNDLLNSYRTEYNQLAEDKLNLSTIGNRTLTKNREYQIANDSYLKELAQIERLKVTMIYLLVCIGVLGLVYIYIIPKKLGFIIIGAILVAYILTIIFINNNFYKRYNLNYAMFKYYTDNGTDTEAESITTNIPGGSGSV
jgi:hypothetical protein